tara:strand:- start:21718 stop:22866 length:1149 start_codon:yes stop_codon:yes gene_type:complete
MHYVEKMSMETGLQITQPFLRESFTPIDADKYITIDIEKENSNLSFSCFQEVVNFIHPILEQEGIGIIQIGGSNQRPLNLTHSIQGKTNISQTSYLIKHSLMHLSSDSTSSILANLHGIPFCCLIKSKEQTVHYPYWENKKGSGVIVSEQNEIIKPERIARILLKLIDLSQKYDFNPPFETIYVGNKFLDGVEFLETLPNQSVDIKPMGAENIMFRMDLLHDEKKLIEQLTLGKVIIITEKPINIKTIKTFRKNIEQIVYVINEEDDPDFAAQVKSLGINLYLFSRLPQKQLNSKKIDYIDIDIIHESSDYSKDREEILSHGIKNLYFKSNKYTLSDSKIYPSETCYQKDEPINSKGEVSPIEDSPLFWNSLENFIIFKKLD